MSTLCQPASRRPKSRWGKFGCCDLKCQKGTEARLITVLWWICAHFREFAKTIKRPFTVRYNPYTQSVDVLKDTPSINSVVQELRHELDIIGDALCRLNKQLGVWPLIPRVVTAATIQQRLPCHPWEPLYTAYASPFVSTMNVSCFWQNVPLSLLHSMCWFKSQQHVSLAAISKLHKPKDL